MEEFNSADAASNKFLRIASNTLGIALIGSPLAPVGIAGVLWGATSGGLGAFRSVRGSRQLVSFLRSKCTSQCGVSGNLLRLLKGIIPSRTGDIVDFLGGL